MYAPPTLQPVVVLIVTDIKLRGWQVSFIVINAVCHHQSLHLLQLQLQLQLLQWTASMDALLCVEKTLRQK